MRSLLLMSVLVASTAFAAERFIGIVELPGLFGAMDSDSPGGVELPADLQPLTLYGAAAPDAPVRAKVTDPALIESREFAPELSGALVYGIEGRWYQLAYGPQNARQKGWVRAEDTKRFYDFGALLPDALTYLTDSWSGEIWQEPQQGKRTIHSARRDVRVLEARQVDARWWARVEVLDGEPCGETEAVAVASGWIPVFDDSANLSVWLHPRGC